MDIWNSTRNSMGGDAARLTVAKVVTVCASAFVIILLSRFSTLEEYGTYSQLLLTAQIILASLLLGLPHSINFFIAKASSTEERNKFLSVYYTVATLLGIFIGIILTASLPFIEQYFHNSYIGSFWYFLALYPLAFIITSSLDNILIVYRKTQLLILYRFLYSLSILSIIIILQGIGYNFVLFIILLSAIHCTFTFIAYRIVNHLEAKVEFSLDVAILRDIFSFSIPIGLAAAVGTLTLEMDKLMIGYLTNTEQLAIYTNAAKELPFSVIASSITAVLLPQMVRLLKDGKTTVAIHLWGAAIELALIILAFWVTCFFPYAEDVITLLYSKKYVSGANIFRIYSLNLLFRCTYFGMILNACGKTKQILYCSIITLVLNMILNPLFFWVFGIIGPSIATFISILIMVLLQLKMTSNILSISFFQCLPLGGISNILLINIAFSIFLFILKQYFDGIYFATIICSICGIAYFALMKNRIMQLWSLLHY